MSLEVLLQKPLLGVPQHEKEALLLPLLLELTAHHSNNCASYKHIIDVAAPNFKNAVSIADIPFLPVTLFKNRRLRSVPEQDIRTTVMSSGTTGQRRSAIDLDAETARLSARSLGTVMATVTNNRRLPFLIIDTPSAVHDKNAINARAAAIMGLMPFGRDYFFALRDDFTVDVTGLTAFLAHHHGQDILVFGFTFLIWQYFIPACEAHGFNLSQATLLHSGGWKKLQDLAVDNDSFKTRLSKVANLSCVKNFYGMAEMPGTIFLEHDDGLLYPPAFADAIIRDPLHFAPIPHGKAGLIEIVSAIPRSYPGHAILTEDLGVIETTPHGQGLRVLGRAPRLELRGCSDVLAAGAAA